MKTLFPLLFLIVVSCSIVRAQEVTRFTVQSGPYRRISAPVSLSLDGLDYNSPKGGLRLYELKGKESTEVPCQFEPGVSPRLWWIIEGVLEPNTVKKYTLVKDSTLRVTPQIKTELTPKMLLLEANNKKMLQYNLAEVFPPDTVSPLFKRSGFIHPVWSPSGNVLTRINAPDHMHHFGIWNPWTKTKFEGHTTDFWNLYEGQGTVRFAGFNSFTSGQVWGGFKVRQEHVDFQCKGGDKVAMNEVWDVRLFNVCSIGDTKVWVWDLSTTLSCASSSPIELEEYRYGGGIGYRATDDWNDKNSWVLTSENKTRKDADGSRARWCDVGGTMSNGSTSGIVFLSHPGNREFPEPMRVWPEGTNKHGDLYFEFCPIRHNGWTLTPGNEYVLRYRMVVYDGHLTPEQAEMVWSAFAYPPKVILDQKADGSNEKGLKKKK